MNLIPAIDLKDNKCVRLTQGKEDSSKIYNKNPVEQAKYFEKQGCKRLHIVDLDAAFGRSQINTQTIIDIKKSVQIPIQLGGGIKNIYDVNFWLKNNIDYLIIGSLAVKNSDLVKKITEEYENKIYISIDLLNDEVMIKGWEEGSKLNIKDISTIYNQTKIKGYILTDISRDGTLEGLDLNLLTSKASLLSKPLIIGGGLSSYLDLERINALIKSSKQDQNSLIKILEGLILGKAFYSGRIEIKKANKILNAYA